MQWLQRFMFSGVFNCSISVLIAQNLKLIFILLIPQHVWLLQNHPRASMYWCPLRLGVRAEIIPTWNDFFPWFTKKLWAFPSLIPSGAGWAHLSMSSPHLLEPSFHPGAAPRPPQWAWKHQDCCHLDMLIPGVFRVGSVMETWFRATEATRMLC